MSEKHLVCQGAICQCIFGTAPDTLKVKTQKKHFINDLEGEEKLIATDQDLGKTLENNTFGSCVRLQNGAGFMTRSHWKPMAGIRSWKTARLPAPLVEMAV